MFKAIKENKIISINETSDFPCLIYDEIVKDTKHTVNDYIQKDGEFVIYTEEMKIEQKKENVKAVREKYFAEYVDFYQSKPLYWEELDTEKQENIRGYRKYLIDYVHGENEWWEENPMDYDTWLAYELHKDLNKLTEEELGVIKDGLQER